jgi:hypothetical protein
MMKRMQTLSVAWLTRLRIFNLPAKFAAAVAEVLPFDPRATPILAPMHGILIACGARPFPHPLDGFFVRLHN